MENSLKYFKQLVILGFFLKDHSGSSVKNQLAESVLILYSYVTSLVT